MTLQDADSLQRILRRRFYEKDAIIFREGDLPNYAFIIRKGAVYIAKSNEDNVALLTTLVAGQMFGELALINGKPRSATAIASEPTEVLMITPEQFKAKMENLDVFMKYLVNHMTARIYDLSARVND